MPTLRNGVVSSVAFVRSALCARHSAAIFIWRRGAKTLPAPCISALPVVRGRKMNEKIEELLSRCRRAKAAGEDFPSIWVNILKGDPLTRGSPVQGHDGQTTTLNVHLSGGLQLVFDGSTFRVRQD